MATGGVHELFIYYRLRSTHASAALNVVQRFQAHLRARHPTMIARLLHRADETDGQQTWMETYAITPMQNPTGIGPDLQSEIEALAHELQPFLDGARHSEVFIACAW